MTEIEIKAKVFDLLKELEGLQIQANKLNQEKNELLKRLEPNITTTA